VEANNTRGGGEASPSKNPPRDFNISSLICLGNKNELQS